MSENAADQNALSQGRNFVWHELYVPDADAAFDFYTKCLGFGSQEMSMGEMGTYKMLTRDGQPVAGVMSTTEMQMQGVPPHWSVYLSVPNVDESLAQCTANGATVVVQPMDVPTIGRMALIADPQGAHIWLFTPSM
jgi:predicted enzyme related to lactoylglutathione lyase